MAHILRTAFLQNPSVGLFGFANDTLCVIGHVLTEKQIKSAKEVLNVPLIQTTICGTDLCGVFIAGNNKRILLPKICFKKELTNLKKQIKVTTIDSKYTALGNLIVTNDTTALISPLLSEYKTKIKKALEVEKIQEYQINEIEALGSLITLTDKGILLSELASEKDQKFIQEFFNLPCTIGTINLGSPLIKSGIITNNKGFILGNKTGGMEAVTVDKALGFLE